MLATRMTRISSSPTMKGVVAAQRLRAAGHDVVDLSAGEPDFATPTHIKEAAHAAIDADFTKYTANTGTPALKQAIAERYKTDYGVEYGDQEIIVSAGGKQALVNVALALLDEGDEVVTHAPGWPSIFEQIKLAGATPVLVRTRSEDGFAITASAILDALTPRTKVIVINSPCNPTGAVITEDEMARIADEAARRGLWVVVDLCYEKLIYDPQPHNLPRVLTDRMRDRAIIAGSASKTYAMTGWRCGWALGPRELIAACGALQSHSTSNVCSITQRAVVAALTGPQACITEMLDEYRRRRDLLHELVTADPRIRAVKPSGAFYLFVDVSELLSPEGLRTSADLADALLEQKHVIVTAGEGFDAPGFLRLSYATSEERLREAAKRFHDFAAALGKGEYVARA